MMPGWELIPGETPIDLSFLKDKSITTRHELNVREAQNISRAVLKYLAAKPNRASARFDLSWSLKLHGEMFGDVWEWAGTTRKHDTNIGVSWTQVTQRLFDLFGDLVYWEQNETMLLLEQAVTLHHRAVQIHPFENGNGRWARMLADIWLKLHDHPTTSWPPETIGAGTESVIRDEYLAALKEADGGKYTPLIEFHRRLTPSPEDP